MFKKDPLSPFTAYCGRYVVTGMGMFTEGYVIFVSNSLAALRRGDDFLELLADPHSLSVT